MDNNNNNKIKDNIKKDLLKNIDKIVNNIYESFNNPSFGLNLEDSSFVIEGNPYKEMSIADDLTGKQPCPPPLKSSTGEESYVEVNIDVIARKIKLSEQIFIKLYKFKYTKGMLLKDIPAGIIDILEVFEMHQGFNKSKDPNADSTAKWLLGVSLFGNLRLRNKINSPYVTNKEAKQIVKGIVKNLKNIYNLINGNTVLIDEENVGILLFDHMSDTKNVIIEK